MLTFLGGVISGWGLKLIVDAVRVHRIRRGNLKRYRPSPWN